MPKHVLVLIHGITPEEAPDVAEQYAPFVAAISQAGLPIAPPICQVRWGVPALGTEPTREDEFLARAQSFVASCVCESALGRSDDAVEELARDGLDVGVPLLREVVRRVRESVVQYGLADALYYAAPDGESAVRNAVFQQVFGKLQAAQNGAIHLHIVAHSLGVTIAHDFLYALFGRKDGDFPAEGRRGRAPELHEKNRALQRFWRREAEAGRLKLGTFISFASQLPLFVMRKQALVEQLAAGKKLDPRVIGIDKDHDGIQWAVFYDADELLGFATRPLYEETPAIRDIRMNSGVGPLRAHLGYWRKRKIVERCIAILRHNMRDAERSLGDRRRYA